MSEQAEDEFVGNSAVLEEQLHGIFKEASTYAKKINDLAVQSFTITDLAVGYALSCEQSSNSRSYS